MVQTTVVASGACTSETVGQKIAFCPGPPASPVASRNALKLSAIACASSGAPDWNVSPSRITNVQVSRSSEISHESTSARLVATLRIADDRELVQRHVGRIRPVGLNRVHPREVAVVPLDELSAGYRLAGRLLGRRLFGRGRVGRRRLGRGLPLRGRRGGLLVVSATGGEQRARDRDGDAEGGRALEEIAPRDLARGVVVDQLLDRVILRSGIVPIPHPNPSSSVSCYGSDRLDVRDAEMARESFFRAAHLPGSSANVKPRSGPRSGRAPWIRAERAWAASGRRSFGAPRRRSSRAGSRRPRGPSRQAACAPSSAKARGSRR